MQNKEIEELTPKELGDELYREMECSWDKETLINHIIDNLNNNEKRDWIKNYFKF